MRKFLILSILFLCAFIRIRGLTWGLPYILEGDEYRVINSGLNIYYHGTQSLDSSNEMGNYPPLRLHEVALTRAFLIFLSGNPVPVALQVLFGRVLSLTYAMLTTAFLYQTARIFTGRPVAGLWAASFFAVLPASIWFGQITLVDGAAMLCFTMTLHFSLLAHRKSAKFFLLAALLSGILATFAKYNASIVLIMPLWIAFQKRYWEPVFISGLIRLLLTVIFMQAMNPDNFVYDYLNPDEQIRYAEQRALSRETQEKPIMPQHLPDRWKFNAQLFFEYFSPLMLPAGIIGVGYFLLKTPDKTIAFVLLVVALIAFIVTGGLIATGARQFFSIMIILILFAATGMSVPAWGNQPFVIIMGMAFLIWHGVIAWAEANYRAGTDSRTATIDWFINNAPSGSTIVSEPVLYEFGVLNGYRSNKTFNLQVTENPGLATPGQWRCRGADYLVTSNRAWNEGAEVVASFRPPHYIGPARYILKVTAVCSP